MTHKAPAGRAIQTAALARVEGEGAMHIAMRDGQVEEVQLRIYEPPRFFEAFLRGRHYTEPPDITARICGICPVAYQMSACRAIEDACGVVLPVELDELRRLLYCGEWIESHTLHIYFLHAPDFLGCDSTFELAERDRPAVERGLALKKAGNAIVETVGGRAVHPVNVRVGGFYRLPTRAELLQLREHLQPARDAALETIAWVSGFEFPDSGGDYELVASRDGERYPVLGDGVRSTGGLDIGVRAFDDNFVETQVPHSHALHAHIVGREHYLTGPLARYSLASERLPGPVAQAARDAGLATACGNPFQSIVVRAVEVLFACHEALRILDEWAAPSRAWVETEPRAGTGYGITEAPRGLLYHRYTIDEDGRITDAKIVPPTSQNQASIEHDLWHVAGDHVDLRDDELRHLCEQTIRNHDPCISCATHFLDLTVERRSAERTDA